MEQGPIPPLTAEDRRALPPWLRPARRSLGARVKLVALAAWFAAQEAWRRS